MPFTDFNTDAGLIAGKNFDITIIGAGAAGILLAVHLARSGKKVLMIESGHFSIDEEKQKLNEGENKGKILENLVWGRKRVIGGTTTVWGGQSLPFSPSDFEHRPWVQNSGWPISYDTIAHYYKRANVFMGIDILNYQDDIFEKINIKKPAFDDSLFDYHVAKWANEPNFQTLYKSFLEQNVTLVYNAQLHRINRSDEESIDSIDVNNFKKESFNLKVTKLIISAGGIESVRILLANNIGDHSGWLGKCFMEHPCIELGDIFTRDAYSLQKNFNTHVWQRRRYSLRLSLSDIFQRNNRCLHCSASIMFKPPENLFDPYAELLSFKKDFRLSRLLKISGSFKSITESIWAYCKDRFYYKPNTLSKLVLMIEQEPSQESYISLSKESDQFGIKKAAVNWNISYKTWDTVIKTADVLKTEIERLSFGKVELYKHIRRDNKEWCRCLSDVNHHMGGCRMSADALNGVVDENLQVWGYSNLYVCSAAVFPTSSHSNPTLTLLALGARLSDHLTNETLIDKERKVPLGVE